jgi:putative thioredoxin
VLTPVLERVAEKHRDRVVLVKVNVDTQPDLAERYRVASIPKVMLFARGAPVSEFVGALPEGEVERWLLQALPSPAASALERARLAIAEADLAEARRFLEEAYATDPSSSEARIMLASLLFPVDLKRARALATDLPHNDPLIDRADAIVLLADLIERNERGEGKPEAWERYFAGARAVERGAYREAFDIWLDLVRRKQSIDEDGPRRAILALFKLLGEDSEQSRELRRSFSAALY